MWQQEASEIVKQQGVILCPTDTVWGISCSALSEQAAKQIYNIKQRPNHKSFIVLVANEAMLAKYVTEIPGVLQNFLTSTTKPTTVIYSKPIGLPKFILAADGSIAIRIAGEQWLADFIAQVGAPIISTSANVSGEPTPSHFFEIAKSIQNQVDYVVPEFQTNQERSSSQIIRITAQNEIEYLRR